MRVRKRGLARERKGEGGKERRREGGRESGISFLQVCNVTNHVSIKAVINTEQTFCLFLNASVTECGTLESNFLSRVFFLYMCVREAR